MRASWPSCCAAGLLSPVYHGENSTLEVQQLGRSYAALTEDTTRIMGRIKALFRSQAIACAGKKPTARGIAKSTWRSCDEAGLRRRAECSIRSWMLLQQLRREARRDLIAEMPQAPSGEAVALGAVSGPDARGAADRAGADAAPLPHQAPVLGLLRAGAGDAQQRRLSRGERPAAAQQEAGVHSRTELEPQPRSEKPV